MNLLEKIQLFQELKEFYSIEERAIIIKSFINDANENINKQKNGQVDFLQKNSLATGWSFFKEYFKELGRKENGIPVHRNNHECFNYLNQKYFS